MSFPPCYGWTPGYDLFQTRIRRLGTKCTTQRGPLVALYNLRGLIEIYFNVQLPACTGRTPNRGE